MIKISTLKNNPNNPRTIKKDALEKLKRSISEFPEMMEKRPMVCVTDAADKKIFPLGGNMRLRAIRELVFNEIPKSWVMMADDWTEEKRREFVIKDNVSIGEWDFEDLSENWDIEQIEDWGLEVPKKWEQIDEVVEDDFDTEPKKETDIILGDLFEIGEHRLLCGDSTNTEDVEKLMNMEKADSCITSPPYNQGGSSGDLFSHGKRVESLYQNEFDNKTKDEFYKFIISVLNNISLIVNNIHSVALNISYNAKSRDDYGKIIFSELNPFSVKETIVWNKGGSINLPQPGIYSRQCEFVFIMSNYDKYLTSQKYGECRWNLWETKMGKQRIDHKATFPIEFAERAINELTLSGNLIFEPFLGSGTTMLAAHQLNRKCYGMELDPHYCDVIVRRMLTFDNDLTIKRNGKDETKKWLKRLNEA